MDILIVALIASAASLVIGWTLGALTHHKYVEARLRWYERIARTRRTVADTVELPGLQAAMREYKTDADMWRLPKERR